MTAGAPNGTCGLAQAKEPHRGIATLEQVRADPQLIDEVEAMWRRECERHVSEPAPLRFVAPIAYLAELLREIGADVAGAETSVAVDAHSAFSCGDLHLAVAQLSALRRAVARTLELSGPRLDRLDELIERAMTKIVKDCVEELCAAALLDSLTGLRNRRAFVADAGGELARANRGQRPVAMALVDMVGLKHVNDDQSHAAGDHALRRLGTVLRNIVREGDNVYRIGGDEFIVLLPGASSDDAAAILTRVNGDGCPFRWGVSGSPDDGADVDALVDVADRRMLEFRRHDGDGAGGPTSRLSGRQD